MKREAVILFTRVPYPGITKTRLMPVYSGKECAELHACFLRDIYKECKKTGRTVFVCYTGLGQEKLLKKILPNVKDEELMLQQGNDLGARMGNAIQKVLESGYDSCVLMGSDVPELKAAQTEEAFAGLKEADTVFIPTVDEGYCLVGMKSYIPEAFQNQAYGSGSVLEHTIRAVKEAGYQTKIFGAVNDIDMPEDLLGLKERMRKNCVKAEDSYTYRYMKKHPKISVIIPVYNEETTIVKLQEQLKKLPDCEIIFVDGGSLDRTVELIEGKYKVLTGAKGRAAQMNLGAKKSAGDILFFLHADSELPDNPMSEIRRVMRQYRWGCFGIAFHEKHFFLWTCQVISNHRIKDRKVVFGDQGIFIDRDLFFEIGMYPELPIMEDYQFSLTLKERGEAIGTTRHHIYSSSRRFKGNTMTKLRIMWKMNRLRKMYRDGVDIEIISRMYKDIR
ncbi:TIGR04283 family arsenosugar biosynthesis glycosyltransferase [Extibacter muris]|uniref:4,4'-diaponeurosporenoate glycosyltransferase n=1 Tax=Extibacter muris TaxID=1796622 RepID=A0A4R4FE87_9FIRM|nr:TIGR04283 family arsenosugar biosynthesis glycosyltransferase [Extibacter muris]MCU0078115.1 TIGR04283 family arsenosugar biosynthesis glycosyltransferase [Extibacter muris]TDA21678.1 DUF2064 domain-containing protein [Extibacter muris]